MINSVLLNFLILLLLSICDISNSAISTGSNWEVTGYYEYSGDTLVCIDYISCILKCYGIYSCGSATIRGPKDESLTIYCDSWYYAPTNAGGSCFQLDIIANESSSLLIYVYNGQNELYQSDIFTPNNGPKGGYSTNIICGLEEPNSPTSPGDANCGYSCRIWAYEGWNDVNWTYYGNHSWSLIEDQSYQSMYCGIYTHKWDYEYSCNRWTIQNDGRYGCKSFSDCDSYVIITNTPTLYPSQIPSDQPTNVPTKSPSNQPTDNTNNPTNMPTIYPTTSIPSISPITAIPTIYPTNNPTNNPSLLPTSITESLLPSDAPIMNAGVATISKSLLFFVTFTLYIVLCIV